MDFFERDKDKQEIEFLRNKVKEQSVKLSLANQKIRYLEKKKSNFRKVEQFDKFEALGKFV